MGTPLLKIVDDNYTEEKPFDISDTKEKPFDISDYDFEPANEESMDIVMPPEIEIMRNRLGDEILLGYAKRLTGLTKIKIKEIFYNRDFKLCIQVESL